jgi:radical SAM protein with 4Fe4S-binding SPASM domain
MRQQRHVWMCVTRGCNFACGYCYQGSHVETPAGLDRMMPIGVLDATESFLRTWAPVETTDLRVTWYGGEPLTNWNLVRQGIERFSNRRQSITTNGSLLVPPVRAILDQYNVGVLLSLDGPPRFHNQSRPFVDGRGTWDSIPVREILDWRPDIEIAWQLDPQFFDPASGRELITPAALDEMMAFGFRNVNFNLNWLARWSEAARWNLAWFMRHAAMSMVDRDNAINDPRLSKLDAMLSGKKIGLGSNWWGKLERALAVDEKMVTPCGTGLNMIGVSPEGWIYPSQEMVYTVQEPGRAPGTAEYYRLGTVQTGIDQEALARISQIRTEQMVPPAPYNCSTCVAKSVSIGGCHCRYVGQDGLDPSNRFDVAPGYCESMTAAVTGMLMGGAIARRIRPAGWTGSGPTSLQGYQQRRQLRVLKEA